jgi:hypothetical protein
VEVRNDLTKVEAGITESYVSSKDITSHKIAKYIILGLMTPMAFRESLK